MGGWLWLALEMETAEIGSNVEDFFPGVWMFSTKNKAATKISKCLEIKKSCKKIRMRIFVELVGPAKREAFKTLS